MIVLPKYLKLPLSPSDNLRADRPVDGILQILAAGGTLLAREEGLRTLFEHEGGEFWVDLADPGDPRSYPWEVEATGGSLVICAGLHRIRPHGPRDVYPDVVMRCRMAAPPGETVGAVVVVRPSAGSPSTAYAWSSVEKTSTSLTSLKVTVRPSPGLRPVAPVPGQSTADPDEAGEVPEAMICAGFWCTSNSGANKGQVHGITFALESPTA